MGDLEGDARKFLKQFDTAIRKYEPLDFDLAKKLVTDDYEKELKRLRNSPDQKYREDNGFVPWKDGYDVMGVIPMRIQAVKYIESSPAPWALEETNQIIRNMMRVV